jgi:hypothetical protein
MIEGRVWGSRVFVAILFLLAGACAVAVADEKRRIVVRVPEAWLSLPEMQRMAGWGRRSGFEIDLAGESAPVPPGGEVVFVGAVPASAAMRKKLDRFPVRLEEKGFVFDGHEYRGTEDAIALTDPARRSESIVLGNAPRAAMRLAGRRLFWQETEAPDYAAVSGDLVKEGKFSMEGRALTIDRRTDRDEIAAQDAFLRSQESVERAGVAWRFRESERFAIARWEPVLRRFLAARRAEPIVVRLFPDPSTKARATGSSRPADVSREKEQVVVDLDVSSPLEPDCVTPVLASAALGAQDTRLFSRPLLLAALGARAAGRWWGREVAGFAAFARAAGVEPAAEQILRADEEVSPILAIGTAASWIEAGARAEGEESVRRFLTGEDAACLQALLRWGKLAPGGRVAAPARRPLPPGFLRGISYAMSNSIGGGYVSPRSRETLQKLTKLSANAISVMPFAFSREPKKPEITFVHRSPQGETDEGTVRAVADARSLGMTAMIKPQIWLPGVFVGQVAMASEEEWGRWFSNYRRFVVHHALVAEASGAAIFCIGTELVGTEDRRRQWLETIAAVRLATGAALTYASNWAAGAPRVSFWDSLDAVGVDFYDPLSSDANASDAVLEAGARRAAAPLAELARRTGKPVLFTEAGYPPVRGAWLAPHDENTGRPLSPGDAARSISAVFRALERESWWRGVYWWKAFSDGRGARSNDRGYNLLGTPSERAVAEGFARLAGEKRASR